MLFTLLLPKGGMCFFTFRLRDIRLLALRAQNDVDVGDVETIGFWTTDYGPTGHNF